MEGFIIVLDWKTQCWENASSPQIDVQIWQIPIKILKVFWEEGRTDKAILKN